MRGDRYRVRGVSRWRVGGRWVRRTAVLSVSTLMFATVASSADAATLQLAPVHFSSVALGFGNFVRSALADAAVIPRPSFGAAPGRGAESGHSGLAAADKAGKGTGHAPGVAKGQLPLAGALDRHAVQPGRPVTCTRGSVRRRAPGMP